jgi:hypothetical protein
MSDHGATEYIDAEGWADQLATCAEGALVMENWLIGESYPDREATRDFNGKKYGASLDWCTKSGGNFRKATFEQATCLAVTVVSSSGRSDGDSAKLQEDLVRQIRRLQKAPLLALPQVSN